MAETKPEVVYKQTDFSKLKVIESLDDFPLWSTRVKASLLSAGFWNEKLFRGPVSQVVNRTVLHQDVVGSIPTHDWTWHESITFSNDKIS